MKPKLSFQKKIVQCQITDDEIAEDDISHQVRNAFNIPNYDLHEFLSSFCFRSFLDKALENIKPIQIEYAIVIQPSTELCRYGNTLNCSIKKNLKKSDGDDNDDNKPEVNLKGIYSFIQGIRSDSPLIRVVPFTFHHNSIVKLPLDLLKEKNFDEFSSVVIHKIRPCRSFDLICSISSLYKKLLKLDNSNNTLRFIRVIFFINKIDKSFSIDDLNDTLSLFNDDKDNVNNLKASSLHFILMDYYYPLNEIAFNSINQSNNNINDYNFNLKNPNSNSNDENNNELRHILNTSSSIENNVIKLSNRSIELFKSLLTNNDSLSNYIKTLDSLIGELKCLYNIIKETKLKLKSKALSNEERERLLLVIETEVGDEMIIDNLVDNQIGNGLPFGFDSQAKTVLEQINSNYNTINTLIIKISKGIQCGYWTTINKCIKEDYDIALNTINAIGLSLSLIDYIASSIKKEISSIIINNNN